MNMTKIQKKSWKVFRRSLSKNLRCSLTQKIFITRELKTHYYESQKRMDQGVSLNHVLGDPETLASAYNPQFRAPYICYTIVSTALTLALLFCVILSASYLIEEWTFKLSGPQHSPIPALETKSVIGCAVKGSEHHQRFGFGSFGLLWAQGLNFENANWRKQYAAWKQVPCFDQKSTLGMTEYAWSTKRAVESPVFDQFQSFLSQRSSYLCEGCDPILSDQTAIILSCSDNPLCKQNESELLLTISTEYVANKNFNQHNYRTTVKGIAITSVGETRTFEAEQRTFGAEYLEPLFPLVTLGLIILVCKFLVWMFYNLTTLARESARHVGRTA